MKKLIASFALTLVLTAGIASPISAQSKPSPITPVGQDGTQTCIPGFNDCLMAIASPQSKPNPAPIAQDGTQTCIPGFGCDI